MLLLSYSAATSVVGQSLDYSSDRLQGALNLDWPRVDSFRDRTALGLIPSISVIVHLDEWVINWILDVTRPIVHPGTLLCLADGVLLYFNGDNQPHFLSRSREHVQRMTVFNLDHRLIDYRASLRLPLSRNTGIANNFLGDSMFDNSFS